MVSLLISFLLSSFCITHSAAASIQSQNISFAYSGFNATNLSLGGVAAVDASGALLLTGDSRDAIGSAFYPQPVPFKFEPHPFSPNASSFSTYFVFAIHPSPTAVRGGYGLAFVLSPAPGFPGAEGGHYLGIFNSSNDGRAANGVFAVEFDTVRGLNEQIDSDGNHVGINVNSMDSKTSKPAGYYEGDNTDVELDLRLETGSPIHAWIEYDGAETVVNVTISPSTEKPSRPLLSARVNLTLVAAEQMYAGFSAGTGREKSSFHYILGWSFKLNGVASSLDTSRLPKTPPVQSPESRSSHRTPPLTAPMKAVIASLSALLLLLLVLLAAKIYRSRMKRLREDDLDDWELECPHRFLYRDLHAATKGFGATEVIGVGGFGVVYRGRLPSAGGEVAVKRISRNSIQGVREFVAEIESLGRLRHKHLVNLQGWCKRGNDLLLVYDYVPNGSLDSLLFSRHGAVLGWERRLNILRGVAAGLLYLHEEWDRVVIHRDIKSSNVLVDGEMNGRLGDFGLARLHERGDVGQARGLTTAVVGTVGYMAPELSRTGKASTRSDVFAFGVLALEVGCGKRPVVPDRDSETGHAELVEWVLECQQMGRILDAADPKLVFTGCTWEEMERVLEMGLRCCHPDPELRPTMRQVVKCLSGEMLPGTGSWASCDSRPISTADRRIAQVGSTSTITGSFRSSSVGAFSSRSMETGR